MTKSEEARARLAKAREAIDAAAKAGDDAAELRAFSDEEAAMVELREAETDRRKLVGKRLERQARAEAHGAYQVGAFDFGRGLLDLDPARIPCDGVAVFRSAPADADKRRTASADEAGRIPDDANVSFLCDCFVAPKLADADAVRFRAFWENEGRSQVATVVLLIQKLGGVFLSDFLKTQK